MGRLRNPASIVIHGHRAPVAGIPRQTFRIVAHGDGELSGDHAPLHQGQGQAVRHLPEHQPRLFPGIGAGKDLTGADAVVFRTVGLDVRHGAGLHPPGVINEQLRVYPEQPVQ